MYMYVHKNIVENWGGLFTFIHKSTIYWIFLKHIILRGKRHMVKVIWSGWKGQRHINNPQQKRRVLVLWVFFYFTYNYNLIFLEVKVNSQSEKVKDQLYQDHLRKKGEGGWYLWNNKKLKWKYCYNKIEI